MDQWILREKISNSPNVSWDNTVKKSFLGLATFQIQWHLLDAQENNKAKIFFAKDRNGYIFMMWKNLQIEYPKRKISKRNKVTIQSRKHKTQQKLEMFYMKQEKISVFLEVHPYLSTPTGKYGLP